MRTGTLCSLCSQRHPDGETCQTLIAAGRESSRRSRSDEDLIGQQLGSFRLVQVLGRGGMGTVYLGEHLVIGSRVAIKVLHRHLSLDPQMVRRFQDEARATNLIGHENIVSIYDLGTLPSHRHYMVMEYLDGQPLSSVTGAFEIPRALTLLSQLCDAVAAAHRVGVIHRDLKLENVFLVRRQGVEQVKVLDFGIAKLLAGDSPANETLAGAILGTPEFMSPEQVAGAPVDARSDVYALGVIAYRLLTGELPFTGGWAQVMLAHQSQAPRPLRKWRAEIPQEVESAVLRALAKLPDERFASADELAQAMRATPGPQDRSPVQIGTLTHGASRRAVEVRDLTRAGAYLLLETGLPKLGERVQLELTLPGGRLAVAADVVQHVPPERARQWKLSPGIAVQFADPSPAFVRRFQAMLTAEPANNPPAPDAAAVLREIRRRDDGNAYGLLQVPTDATFGEIRRAASQLISRLESLREAQLPPELSRQLATLLDRVNFARLTLGDPVRRAEHDGRIGNFRGVARCLAAGLRVDELEGCRRRVMAESRRGASNAALHLTCARAWEEADELGQACEELVRGLTEDPLHLELHRQYARLERRRLAGTEAA